MKKYNYCFLMAAIYVSPYVNQYVAYTLVAIFTITGLINVSKDQ